MAEQRPGGPRPPTWTREELVLALDLYFHAGRRWLPPRDEEVGKLSDLLNRLDIHDQRGSPGTFRNRSGVAMKLANFLALDPEYTSAGRLGLSRGGHRDKVVWDEIASDPARLHAVAAGIRATDGEDAIHLDRTDEEAESYADGRYAYRIHRARERNPRLTRKKRDKALECGSFRCETCGLDPFDKYGASGRRVLECHHVIPLSQYKPGQRTRLADLVLVCASCHRVLHAREHVGGVSELREALVAHGS